MRRVLVILALLTSILVGLLAIAITARSMFVTDNASWHSRRVQPISAAPPEYREQWNAPGYWVELSDWGWLSEWGVLYLHFGRYNALRSDDDFSSWHYGPGFNYWRLDEAVKNELPPEAWGLRYFGVGWYERTSSRIAGQEVWVPVREVRLIRVPLPLIALVALVWPGLRALAWLRRRQRGFPVLVAGHGGADYHGDHRPGDQGDAAERVGEDGGKV